MATSVFTSVLIGICILESRASERQQKRVGTLLDESDLRTIEKGEAGIPVPTRDEQQFLTASRKLARIRTNIQAHPDPLLRALLAQAGDAYPTLYDCSGLLQLATGLPFPMTVLHGHEHPVVSIAFRGDGARVVTASLDGTARVWRSDGADEPMILRGHSEVVLSAAFSPDSDR
jgi:WD40 repeat protein